MKSRVFAILALSTAKVSSVSSCLGTSTPARRATAPLAVSQAICTWRFIGNMFGKRRQLVNTVGSILFASACACALSRIAERFLSALTKRGVLAWYMEMFMGIFRIERCAHSTARRPAKARGRRAARPYRLLRADKLLHELREDNNETGNGHRPGRGAQPDDPRNVDRRVGKARPEEELRAQERHVVGLACRHRHEHQRGEKHQVLEHVVVRARRAASPAGDLREAFAVAHEPHEAHLVERRRRRPVGSQVCKLLTPYATSWPASSAKSRSTHSTSCDPSDASKANERVTQSLGPVTDR